MENKPRWFTHFIKDFQFEVKDQTILLNLKKIHNLANFGIAIKLNQPSIATSPCEIPPPQMWSSFAMLPFETTMCYKLIIHYFII